MIEITERDKVEFLKIHFPAPSYSLHQVAEFLHCSIKVLRYWLQIYDVPRFKVTGSSFLLRENLIVFLMRADKRWASEENGIGINACMENLAAAVPRKESSPNKPR